MTGRRSWHTYHVAHLHLTIEAEPRAGAVTEPAARLDFERHGRLTAATRWLVELLEEHRLAATWAVGDPAHSAVTAMLALCEGPHELALLGDHYWLGPAAGRKRFAHELARRVTQARAKGVSVSTLVPRVAPVAEHIDLVVKHELRTVVAVDGAASLPRRVVTPTLLHYGVWELGTTDRLPQSATWSPLRRWRLDRSLRRAAREAATIHWVIDLAAVAEQGRWAVRTIAGLTRQAAQLRDRGLLRVETLAAAAARLSALPATRPQRSILRPAA